jgi:hypothetical protein
VPKQHHSANAAISSGRRSLGGGAKQTRNRAAQTPDLPTREPAAQFTRSAASEFVTSRYDEQLLIEAPADDKDVGYDLSAMPLSTRQ